MLLLAITLLSCSKEDGPEIEASRSSASMQQLLLGKWFVDLAPSEMASHCLSQYYLDFKTEEVKNTGTLAMIDDQPELLVTTVTLTKICELPDETTHAYTWADDESFTVMIDAGPMAISIISISSTHLILHNSATDKMMILKKGS
tara:strand:- start:1202 stop:1636 length:435 start_codon:yes stop_codon:yes gene_type:complete